MKAMFGRIVCGLLGGGLMATALHTPQAMALPEDELLDKFAEVPVFVLIDGSGGYVTPVSDPPNDGLGNVALLRVFFSEDDVISFVEQVREEKPRYNQGGSVGVIDLATVHRLAATERDIPLKLVFIPQQDDLQAALELDSEFGGNTSSSLVPLFTLQDASGGFLPLSVTSETEGEETLFSMFLSKQDAENVLNAVQQSNPEMSDVSVGVVSLADISGEFLSTDDESFELIRFLPDSEVINHIQDLNLE
ncbi:MAG: Tic22 family protein [Leptolyngbyaceae cyanobacterium]